MFRRILATAVSVVLAVLLLVATWPQLLGVHRTLLFAEASALRGLIVVAAFATIVFLVVVALLWVSLRRIAAGLALVLFAVIGLNAAVLATRGFGDPAFQEKAPADIRVFAWNTLGDAPGPELIARFALEHDVDVLALPETSQEAAEAIAELMAAGGSPVAVHVLAVGDTRAQSTALLIGTRLGEYVIDEAAGTTPRLPSVVAVPVDGTGPVLVAAHPVAPIPGYIDEWEPGLNWLAEQCRRDDVIVAGDLNATLDHFEGLESGDGDLGGCVDGARATGNGALGTWPSQLPELLGAPIDHIMATPAWEFVGFRVVGALDGEGSDHRALLAQLRPVG